MLRASSRPLPLFFRSARGSCVTDVDGSRYLDYSLAWGPLILGHRHPAVIRAVREQLGTFDLLGAQHELEIELAQRICRMVPCAELVALSNTGSEAVQLALRLARAHTKKRKVIKFEGHYHGWMDNILVSYHSKGDLGLPHEPQLATEGQSETVRSEVLVLPWNDLERLESTLVEKHQEIAAVILEPILCNSGCLVPRPGYLEGVRKLTTRHGVVLIFDEVITGFRVALGGAQELFRVTPDLATLGKAVGGGFPLSVVAGRKEILRLIPEGHVIHAGTFNGSPVALAAGLATLAVLSARGGAALKRVRHTGETLMRGLRNASRRHEIDLLVNGVGAAFHLSFTRRKEMYDYRDTLDSDTRMRDQFIEGMLQEGVYLLPDGRWYVSAAHSEANVKFTLAAAQKVFANLVRNEVGGA
jgi:glutamate-1-semialdehyde 2,1-aminomutase